MSPGARPAADVLTRGEHRAAGPKVEVFQQPAAAEPERTVDAVIPRGERAGEPRPGTAARR
jgi:hypothetical protein